MLKSRLWLMPLISVAAVANTPPALAETLQSALAKAYSSNPDLDAQRAILRQLDENVAIAESGRRPTVTGSVTAQRSHDTSFFGSQPPTLTQYNSTDQSYQAQVNQPLFRGNRITNNVRAADANVEAGRETLRNTEINVLQDAVSAYMDVVRDMAVLALNENQVSVLDRQLQASRDRFEVGELTRTDVAQSEARLARAISDRTAAQGALTVSREAYRRVVGEMPEQLDAPTSLPSLPPTIDDALGVADNRNPLLGQARATEKAADYQVKSAKGTILPSIDAIGNFSNSRSASPLSFLGGTTTAKRRSTTIAGGVRLTVPLYQGGAEYANIRSAQQLRSQRSLEVSIASRRVEQNVRDAWANLTTAQATIQSANTAVKSNEIALEGVRQEQQVGSRTVLDVLDAEQELLNARVTLVRAQRDEVVASYALLGALGELTAKDMGLGVALYDPTVHYKETKYRWFGWDSGRELVPLSTKSRRR